MYPIAVMVTTNNHSNNEHTFSNAQHTTILQCSNILQFGKMIKSNAVELQAEACTMTGGFTFQQHLMQLLHHLAAVHLQTNDTHHRLIFTCKSNGSAFGATIRIRYTASLMYDPSSSSAFLSAEMMVDVLSLSLKQSILCSCFYDVLTNHHHHQFS